MKNNKVRKLTKDNIKEIHRDIDILHNNILIYEEELNYGELHPAVYRDYLEAKQELEYWSEIASNHFKEWGY